VNELAHEQDTPHLQAVGPTRLAFAGVHAARLASGPVLTDLAIGIAIAALTAACLAPAFLASSVFAGDPTAIGRMTVIAALSYLTPEQGMVCIPEMLKFRQSAGAMFALLALAGGMSLGHLAWVARAYGRKPAVLWGVMVLGLTVAAAYAVDAALPAVGTANADNDHFNRLSNPFEGHHGIALLSEARRQLATIGAAQWTASALMILLVLSGFIMNSTRGSRQIDAWLASLASASTEAVASPRESAGLLNRPLPAQWGFVMVLSLPAVLALAGAYAYYPAPVEVFRDMQIIKADLYGELSSPSPNAPLHHLDLWDRQASRLSTGARLRLVAVSTETRQTTEELREAIRSIRLAIEQGRRDEARSLFASAQKTYERCRDGYGVH
jgi:hypothetical protein